jgi:threonine synthase
MPWSYATHYVCDRCTADFSLSLPLNTCPRCGGLLEVQYDLQQMKQDISPDIFKGRGTSMWRWHEFYPLKEDTNKVSLGEGGTPLIKSVYAAKELGLRNLYFKNDTLMPTGSFKDRGFSLAISFAKELGISKGLTYSSGNAGASFAAYSSRAAIDATVLVEYLANPVKKAIISLYGANVATLHFNNFEEITNMLEVAVQKLGLYQFVNFINPIRHEAMKSYAYEICEEFGWQAPDIMVHPVGTGGGIYGAWKGFRELKTLGWINTLPRMVAVQPEATGPITRAYQSGKRKAVKHGDSSKTIAQSISGNAPIQDGERVLNTIYDSGGFAENVSDAEIVEAVRWLGHDGICAEPASAASLAAAKKGVEDGRIQPNDTVVCVITGNGLKQASIIEQSAPVSTHKLNATISELEALIAQINRT